MDNNKNNLEKTKEKKCCKLWKKIIIIIIIFAVIFFIWVLTLEGPKSSQEEWLSQFSEEDLKKLDAQYNKANIPTRTTPEQTYAALKEALKNGDVEAAVNCFTEEKRGEWRENFQRAKNESFIKQLAEDLSDDFTKNSMYESIASYSIPQNINGEIFDHVISFIKDSNGDWKIKSL